MITINIFEKGEIESKQLLLSNINEFLELEKSDDPEVSWDINYDLASDQEKIVFSKIDFELQVLIALKWANPIFFSGKIFYLKEGDDPKETLGTIQKIIEVKAKNRHSYFYTMSDTNRLIINQVPISSNEDEEEICGGTA